MAASNSSAEVAVVGLGRVGLPLALSFAGRGLRTIGVDRDPRVLESVREGRMPFAEPGAQELLGRVREAGTLTLTDRVADAAAARQVVLTIGTPSFSHIEIDMRDIRSALDDLLGVLQPGHSLILRSTIAPGTTDFVAGYLAKHRGFQVGEEVFVAHAPERIAASRFLEEIDTLPCIIGGVGERSGEVAAELFGVFDAPIVQTTPVQAELAKIWTNILRYTQFALPNLLMMDCERHAANVFEVIDLINRDYPRGGIAQPGLTAGTCLRKDFTFSEERSAAPGMLLAVSRVNESVPAVPARGSQAAPRHARRPARGGARARLQGRHRRRAGLAGPQADPPRRAGARRRRRPRPRGGDPDGLAGGGPEGGRRGGGGRQPLRLPQPLDAGHDRLAGLPGVPGGGPVELLGRGPGVRLRLRARGARRERVSRVLVTGGAGTIGAAVVRHLLADPAYEVRVSDQRPAPQWMREGCEVHTGDLREPEVAKAAMAGCTHVVHLAAIVGGIANFHRLPYTLTDVNNALYNAVFGAAIALEVERLVYVSSSMVFERAELYPTPEDYLPRCPVPRSAYGFSKLTGEVYCRAAHDEHDLPFTIVRPFNAYGPGELPDAEPGIAHAVPDLINKVLAGQRPLQIFGSGEQTRTLTHVDDIAEGTICAMSSPAGLNEDFNISASRELTVAEIAAIVWEACGEDPEELEFEHLPTFEVDVQRRWPSVEKARQLLGWESRIDAEEGIASTVRWLRELPQPIASGR